MHFATRFTTLAEVFESVLQNLTFLLGNFIVPLVIIGIALMIRHKSGLSWTSGADVFTFLSALHFAILFNVKELGDKINPVFGAYLVETFVSLALFTLFLLVWALLTESEIENFQCSRICLASNVEAPFPEAGYPQKRVLFFWMCILTLITANIYVLVGGSVS